MSPKSRTRSFVWILALGTWAACCHAQAPWAATQTASGLGTFSAALTGMATPRGQATQAWFEWGTNVAYSRATAPVDVGSGPQVVWVRTTLTGLAPRGIYHYRLVAVNASGVSYGLDHQFTTGTRISAWTDPVNGRPPVAGDLTNIVAIGCGHTHALAVRNDGTVASWFSYVTTDVGQTNVPAGLSNVVAVTGGWVHSLALRQDGTVVAWGRYFDNFNDVGPAFVPAGLSNVIAIAGGDEHSVALLADGSVQVWGINSHGQLNVPSTVTNVVAISAGSTHTLALRADGIVVAWGTSVGGDMTPPSGLSNVVAIATEAWHNLALRANGTVVAWGSNQAGETVVPAQLANVVAIAAGFRNSLALLSSGALVAWGDPAYINNLPASLLNPVTIASGDFQSVAIAAINLAPVVSDSHANTVLNQDLVLSLAGWDPNGDTLSFRNANLPTRGHLYQFSANGRGDLISTNYTPIIDPLHRVIFAPAPGSFGVPDASFSYVCGDGENTSVRAAVTLNVLTNPLLQPASFSPATGPGFTLSFSGIPNVTYQVFGSLDLRNWRLLGTASQPSPGQFNYLDTEANKLTRRCYRVQVVSP